jgi:uncharacterized sulfatase
MAGVDLTAGERSRKPRPNILWISTEDISPDLGCYGDRYAVTPNIDHLAAEGVRYDNVFSHSGVCAPTRSGIITGMYPTTIGTHHMRCKGVPPAHVKCFSEYLRAAGYYCTNNVKTDYQFDPPLTAWDESSRNAHWRKRAKDQPFFAIFNFTTSHESQIRNRSKKMLERIAALAPDEKHDPAEAVLPPYYPDTPEVRKDWAQYYDIITLMDKQVADVLKQLEDDGLADDTIVWFWGDHGRGLPRGKRWIYDSGSRIPLIIRVPRKWRKLASPRSTAAVRPGTVNDDLIAFIDFAPTMLSLAGVKIPEHIQGRAFLGTQKAKPRQYVYAARDRMDEAYDLIRAVRDKRYKYIRNYMHHVTYGQDIEYMNQMPTMREMRRLNAEGKLEGPQKLYFLPTKPVEELYDTQSDPHEVKNLAGGPKYKDVLLRMRKAHNEWLQRTDDMGLIPEPEFDEMKRPGGKYEKTEEPYAAVKNKTDASADVTLSCWTEGASIAYKIGDVGDKKTGWKLYTKPMTLKQGEVLRAKACRIGFRDSDEIKYKLGDPVSTPPKLVAKPHWRQGLDKTNLLDRLRNIKALDGKGGPSNYLYLKGIKDNYASVRYWAAVGLHTNAGNPADMTWATTALKLALKDPAPVVRIAAAHALCDWGHEEEALPVLTEALMSDSDKARLFAIIAMKKIGEKARPALPAIKAMSKDSDNYVKRVTQAVLKRLEK